MLSWHFDPHPPNMTYRDSNASEFFAGTSTNESLVREAIQNSLDASDDDDDTDLVVRFSLRTVDAAVVRTYFKSGEKHLLAPANGLTDRPDFDEPCRVLVVEDFGTTGLEGDATTHLPPHREKDERNNFFMFFRAEALTDKGPSKFGQRGVGKDVFVSASRCRAILGLTIRESDQQRTPLLMGKCILKMHFLDDGTEAYQDGFFGLAGTRFAPVTPTSEAGAISQFSSDFGVTRGEKTGTTVVVPWADEEIVFDQIVDAAVTQYFYPILRRRLRVEVVDETGPEQLSIVLNDENLLEMVNRLREEVASELRPLVNLAQWSLDPATAQSLFRAKQPTPACWKWEPDLLSEEDIAKLAMQYGAGERVAVRFPVTLHTRSQNGRSEFEEQDSHFDVYLEQAPERRGRVRPCFLRQDLLVPSKTPTCPGTRAIVFVDDSPMSAFLGTAENPTHTEWEHKRHKDRYRRGADTCLTFFKSVVKNLIQAISQADSDVDRTIFADLFPMPPDEEAERTRRTKKRSRKNDGDPDPTEPDEIPDMDSREKGYIFSQIEGGFRVSGKPEHEMPEEIVIQAAYNVRHGSPMKRYERNRKDGMPDFDFDAKARKRSRVLTPEIRRRGGKIGLSGNRIVFQPTEENFAIEVTGFDTNRDLVVQHRAKYPSSADEENDSEPGDDAEISAAADGDEGA